MAQSECERGEDRMSEPIRMGPEDHRFCHECDHWGERLGLGKHCEYCLKADGIGRERPCWKPKIIGLKRRNRG